MQCDCSPDNIIEVAVTLLSIILPAKATEYVLPALVCVSVCVCLSVCDHDNWKDCERICTKFYGKVPRGKGKTKVVFCYHR